MGATWQIQFNDLSSAVMQAVATVTAAIRLKFRLFFLLAGLAFPMYDL